MCNENHCCYTQGELYNQTDPETGYITCDTELDCRKHGHLTACGEAYMNGVPIANTTGCVDPYACGYKQSVGDDEIELVYQCKIARMDLLQVKIK